MYTCINMLCLIIYVCCHPYTFFQNMIPLLQKTIKYMLVNITFIYFFLSYIHFYFHALTNPLFSSNFMYTLNKKLRSSMANTQYIFPILTKMFTIYCNCDSNETQQILYRDINEWIFLKGNNFKWKLFSNSCFWKAL